jgi:hypothetical protein
MAFSNNIEFNPHRAIFYPAPGEPSLQVTETIPLKTALERGLVFNNTPLQLAEALNPPLAFVTLQLVYYHIAQGQSGNQPWTVSFCVVCNAGACFSPCVNGQTLHFEDGGLYNAMLLMRDQETGSYWDHINGKCLYGALAGQQLERLCPMLHITAERALEVYPDVQLAFTVLTAEQEESALEDQANFRQSAQPDWSFFIHTLDREDTRLPRLDMGLGVWTEQTSLFYPMTRLHSLNNALIHPFEGRRLLVYIDPASDTPTAFYTEAKSATWRGDVLMLDNGDSIRWGVLYNAKGERKPIEHPQQLFQRWYGFAFAFPECEIYRG